MTADQRQWRQINDNDGKKTMFILRHYQWHCSENVQATFELGLAPTACAGVSFNNRKNHVQQSHAIRNRIKCKNTQVMKQRYITYMLQRYFILTSGADQVHADIDTHARAHTQFYMSTGKANIKFGVIFAEASLNHCRRHTHTILHIYRKSKKKLLLFLLRLHWITVGVKRTEKEVDLSQIFTVLHHFTS